MALCQLLRGTILKPNGRSLITCLNKPMTYSSITGQKFDNALVKINKIQISNRLTHLSPTCTAINAVRTISLSPARHGHGGDHSKLWVIERVLSLTLLGTVPLCIMFPCPVFDAAAAISIVLHQYWGFEGIIQDYVRPIIVGELLPVVCQGLLVGLTLATLGGLLYFIYNDIGIGNAIRRIWNLGRTSTDCGCSDV